MVPSFSPNHWGPVTLISSLEITGLVGLPGGFSLHMEPVQDLSCKSGHGTGLSWTGTEAHTTGTLIPLTM